MVKPDLSNRYLVLQHVAASTVGEASAGVHVWLSALLSQCVARMCLCVLAHGFGLVAVLLPRW